MLRRVNIQYSGSESKGNIVIFKWFLTFAAGFHLCPSSSLSGSTVLSWQKLAYCKDYLKEKDELTRCVLCEQVCVCGGHRDDSAVMHLVLIYSIVSRLASFLFQWESSCVSVFLHP